MNTQILAILSGVSGFIGFLSVLSYFFILNRDKKSETAVRRIVDGEGVLNSEIVIDILKQFNDDEKRLKALQTIADVDSQKATKVFSKIKDNVDIGNIITSSQGNKLKTQLITGLFFCILAILGLNYILIAPPPPPPNDVIQINFSSKWDVNSGYICTGWGSEGWAYASIDYSGKNLKMIDKLTIYKGGKVFAQTTGQLLEEGLNSNSGDGLKCGICNMVWTDDRGGAYAKERAWAKFVSDWSTPYGDQFMVEYTDITGRIFKKNIPSFMKEPFRGKLPTFDTVEMDPDVNLSHDDDNCKPFIPPCKNSTGVRKIP